MHEFNTSATIRKLIADHINAGETVLVSSLVREIEMMKPDIFGADADFYLGLGRRTLTDMVRAAIGKYNAIGSKDEQLVLEGFQDMQVAYTFKRNGQVVLVPIDKCTIEELETRAEEFRQMSGSLINHRRELLKYCRERRAVEASLSVAAE